MTTRPLPDADKHVDGQEADDGARQTFWAELGLTEPEFLDESLAPEIDEELLRLLVRQALPESAARAVYRRVYSFRSWHRAHAKVLLEELKRARPSTDANNQNSATR